MPKDSITSILSILNGDMTSELTFPENNHSISAEEDS